MEPHPLTQLRLPTRPLFVSRVHAGFPSPAEDYLETNLNLHDYAVRHPAATFFVRVVGDSMAPGIVEGDILVVDKSITALPGMVILAVVDGEFAVKRLAREHGRIVLHADNPRYASIVISSGDRFQVWGVVTYVLHDPNG